MTLRILEPPANIFESGAYAICVPVNAVGTPGKGLALAAAERWPEWARDYREACARGDLRPGGMQHTYLAEERCRVIALAVKDHWRDPARLVWAEAALGKLAAWCRHALPPSVALPALGCGLGALPWDDVRPLTERILGEVHGVEFLVYAPHEAPRPRVARRG